MKKIVFSLQLSIFTLVGFSQSDLPAQTDSDSLASMPSVHKREQAVSERIIIADTLLGCGRPISWFPYDPFGKRMPFSNREIDSMNRTLR